MSTKNPKENENAIMPEETASAEEKSLLSQTTTRTRGDFSEIFNYDFEDFSALVRGATFREFIDSTVLSHWHDDFEFTVATNGSFNYFVNDKRIVLKEGQAIFVNSRQLHSEHSDDPDASYIVALLHPSLLCASRELEENFVAPVLGARVPYLFFDGSEEWHQRIIDLLCKMYEYSGSRYAPLKIQSLFYEIWLIMSENAFSKMAKVRQSHSVEKGLTSTRDMIRFIQNNYNEKIELLDIANAGLVSKSTALRLFQKYLRTSPVSYLINYRLRMAAKTLIKTGDSVTNIALDNGFLSASYFIEMFRRCYGVNPSEYRKQNRANEALSI